MATRAVAAAATATAPAVEEGGGGSGFVSQAALTSSGQAGKNLGNGKVVISYVAGGTTTTATTTTTSTTTTPGSDSGAKGKQKADVNAACRTLPRNLNPRTVLNNGIPITVTIDVPGTVDTTIAEGGAGSTLPIAHDLPGAHAAAAGDPGTIVCSSGTGSTLPIASDLPSTSPTATANAAKCKPHKCPATVIVLAHLRKTFTTPGGKQKLRVPLTGAGKRAFTHILALDKAYIKKHGHHGKPPRLKLRTTIAYTPR